MRGTSHQKMKRLAGRRLEKNELEAYLDACIEGIIGDIGFIVR